MKRSPEGRRTFDSRAALAVAAAIAFAVALAVAGSTPVGRELQGRLARPSAPERALGSPRLRAALLRESLIELRRPDDGATVAEGDCAPIELGAPRHATADASGAAAAAASAMLDPLESNRPPRIELELDSCRMARLHAWPEGRGRSTEETGWLTIRFGDGRSFATPVGVRLHGGTSRRSPPYSYRLYFRDSYGAAGAPGEIVGDAEGGLVERLVLNEVDDRDRDGSPFPFPGEVSLAIARRLGAVTPAFRPAVFVLNDEPPRPVVALEQIGDEFLRRRFGHANFDVVRGKRFAGDADQEPFRLQMEWLASLPAPLSAESVGARYDLESLLDWLVTVSFCGTGDLYQDALVRDRSGEVRGGRWFWVHWDHDMSFRSPPGNSRFGRCRDALEAILWSQRASDSAPARALVRRLLAEDPAFRERVHRHFEAALATELTPDFLAGVVGHYEGEARRLEMSDLHFAPALREYFERRPEAVRTQLQAALALAVEPGAEPDRIRYGRRRRTAAGVAGSDTGSAAEGAIESDSTTP